MELNQHYLADRYTEAETSEIRRLAKIRIKYLSSYLKRINPKKILELGCGEGSLALEIKKLLGNVEIYGLDLSEAALRLAEDKGIITRKADLNEKIPFRNNEFDLVFSNQVIEHINNTDLFFQESLRVLKKGGYFIVITPNLSFWVNRITFPFGIYPVFSEVSMVKKNIGAGFLKKFMFDEETVGHIRVFNLAALIDMLKLYRFKIEKVIGIPFPFQMPKIFGFFYRILDWLFSKKPSLARDIMVIARK